MRAPFILEKVISFMVANNQELDIDLFHSQNVMECLVLVSLVGTVPFSMEMVFFATLGLGNFLNELVMSF